MAGRLHFEKGNAALSLAPLRCPFEDPACKAHFHFGVNPCFDELPELLAEIRDLTETGKFEGFERRLGATQQVIDIWLRVVHVRPPDMWRLPRQPLRTRMKLTYTSNVVSTIIIVLSSNINES